MKLTIIDRDSKGKGEMEMPSQFNEVIRPDLVRRAVRALQSKRRQKYGAHPHAGMRAVGELSRRRKSYRGSYGFGISRVQRKIMSRRGRRLNWVGAVVPGTVGGRRAHPPQIDKEWAEKINKKENRYAIRSAISATVISDLVKERGHRIPDSYPFILDTEAEKLSKTSEVREMLKALGFGEDLKRAGERKIRAGKGKLRGRKYKVKKGPLLVVGSECELFKSARNIAGINIVQVRELNAEVLAPGADIGRATIWTKHACEVMAKEGMFQ